MLKKKDVCNSNNPAHIRPNGFLHHNQIFDVTIEKRNYDIQNSIVTQKAGWLNAHLTRRVDKLSAFQTRRPGLR